MILEKKFKEESFIGGWYMPKDVCDRLIHFFNLNKDLTVSGFVYRKDKKVIRKSVKESTDLHISPYEQGGVIGEYRNYISEITSKYLQKFKFANKVSRFGICDFYNIQHYPIKGGFKKWHHEVASLKAVHRHLVFMTYLNDVEDGGTEFLYQKIKTNAEKGLTLIWPAIWTHTHRGIVSKTKEKYIVTGWHEFIRQENNND